MRAEERSGAGRTPRGGPPLHCSPLHVQPRLLLSCRWLLPSCSSLPAVPARPAHQGEEAHHVARAGQPVVGRHHQRPLPRLRCPPALVPRKLPLLLHLRLPLPALRLNQLQQGGDAAARGVRLRPARAAGTCDAFGLVGMALRRLPLMPLLRWGLCLRLLEAWRGVHSWHVVLRMLQLLCWTLVVGLQRRRLLLRLASSPQRVALLQLWVAEPLLPRTAGIFWAANMLLHDSRRLGSTWERHGGRAAGRQAGRQAVGQGVLTV